MPRYEKDRAILKTAEPAIRFLRDARHQSFLASHGANHAVQVSERFAGEIEAHEMRGRAEAEVESNDERLWKVHGKPGTKPG